MRLAAMKKEPAPATPASSGLSWISSWWSGSSQSPTSTAAEVETEQPVLSEADIKALYATIDYDPSKTKQDTVFPPEVGFPLIVKRLERLTRLYYGSIFSTSTLLSSSS
jgi:hypothetical protein